jgi:beta-glucosidase
VGFTTAQWPGVKVETGLESTYTEKLNIGYRWYDTNKVAPKFAFGHGLTYANFSYSGLKVGYAAEQAGYRTQPLYNTACYAP